jgi:hypothetical protein
VEQKLLTIPEHLSSLQFLVGFMLPRVTLVLCAMLCRSLFAHFPLAIVLSVLLLTDSDYLFGIFKLFVINSIAYTIKETSNNNNNHYTFGCFRMGAVL